MQKSLRQPARFSIAWMACLIAIGATGYVRSQTQNTYGYPQQATYQYPATNSPGMTESFNAGPVIGFQPQNGFQSPAVQQPGQSYFPATQGFQQPQLQGPIYVEPGNVLDIDVTVPQNPTARLSIGGTYGSDNGLVGQLIFDEKDFDIGNFPCNVREACGPAAWKGGGAAFSD